MKSFLAFALISCAAAQTPATFNVYRAAAGGTNSLLNVDAADAAGVLGYLHPEVIPLDMGSCSSQWGFSRKFGIDVIVKFEVTVLNPLNPTGNCSGRFATPPVNGYSAYDGGRCTDNNDCPMHATCGYYVGQQSTAGNPRHHYYGFNDPDTGKSAGNWYSFPAQGHCDSPTGAKDCTYSYKAVGKLYIDDLVNAFGKEQIEPSYPAWCQEPGNVEYSHDRASPCNTTKSIAFWNKACYATLCQMRLDFMESPNVTKLYQPV